MPSPSAVMPTSFDRNSADGNAAARTFSHDTAKVKDTFEHLVREHYAYIRRLALTILDDGNVEAGAEADDAAQETFITAYRALAGFRGRASLKTWLTAIAVNTCRARLRKRKLRQALHATLRGLHLSERLVSPEETAAQNETHRQLWQAVDSLDEKHRLPVILRYVHQLTVPEIAESLGTNEGTVHSRLHYARRALLGSLGQYNEEAPDEPFA
jgi:RNA polymerase sigma-70 factor (ECF subfamily)